LLLADPRIDPSTALFRCCQYNKIELVKLLLSRTDIDVNRRCDRGWLPLVIVSVYGLTEIVDLLLDNPHINVNALGRQGRTTLSILCHDASKTWCSDKHESMYLVIEKLLARPDIDVNLASNGVTPLQLARSENNQRLIDMLLAHPRININTITNTDISISEPAAVVCQPILASRDTGLPCMSF
jgi:ankyrin repeat protein